MGIRKAVATVCVLACVWPAMAAAREWQLIPSMTLDQLASELETAKPEGLVPAELDATLRGGELRYSVVWLGDMGDSWQLRVGMSREGVLKNAEDFEKLGLAPSTIQVEVVDGTPQYAGLWLPSDGSQFEVALDQTTRELDAMRQQMIDEGFVPVSISGYTVGGEVLHSLISIENTDDRDWSMRYGLTATEFNAHITEIAGGGLTPVDVSAYDVGGETRFAVVSLRIDGVTGYISTALSAEQVNAQQAPGATLVPTLYAEYDTPAGARYVLGWNGPAADGGP